MMIRRSFHKFWFMSSSGGSRLNSIRDFTERRYISSSPIHRNSKTAKGKDEDEDLDKPIPFTTSKAAQTSAQQTLGGNPFPNAPWYQPYVVSLSVGIFLLYFLALREESDIDERIGQPLWQKVPGLEKQQLLLVLEYNRNHNLDTADIERRLKEIEIENRIALQNKNSSQ